jgi:MOSC domain-containing protein YiiM
MAPTLLSIQVGKPQMHAAETKKAWESGIFKAAIAGPVWLGQLNLAGDGQQDLSVHGGPFRAVMAYCADYYPTWRDTLGIAHFDYGAFGENFTISELNETLVCLGDIYRVGDAVIQVTQPRQPCWKLARRWDVKQLTALVHNTSRGGWYHRVLTEGNVEAGQAVTLLERTLPDYPIIRVNALMNEQEESVDVAEAYAALATVDALTPSWRERFAERANQLFER